MNCTAPVAVQRPYGSMMVPCGRCRACRRARAREWALRMLNELEAFQYGDAGEDAVFATLTYSDEYLPENGSLDKEAVQLFLKRFRKGLEPRRIRYYCSGEYGSKSMRPHYHLVVFGVGERDREALEKAWPYGMVHVGSVTARSVRYCANYVQKALNGKLGAEVYGERELPFSLKSQGLGRGYCEENREKLLKERSVSVNGYVQGLPRYYCKRLGLRYNDEESLDGRIESTVELRRVHEPRAKRFGTFEESVEASRKQYEKNLEWLDQRDSGKL